jgi:hypothetical protein
MIKSCSSLKHFTYFGHTYLDIEPDWYHNVLKSLSTHVASLKRLSFDGCRHDDLLVLPSFTFQLQLGVLDQLDTYAGPLTLLLNPEQLEMPNQLVALADHLPSTIETSLIGSESFVGSAPPARPKHIVAISLFPETEASLHSVSYGRGGRGRG